MNDMPCLHVAEARICRYCSGYEDDRVTLSRVSGALCDASTVVVDPPEQGIHELTFERDYYRARLADLVAVVHAWRTEPKIKPAFDKARETLKNGPIPPARAVPPNSDGVDKP